MPDIQNIIIWSIPVIFAITFHELAHGYVANIFGDGSAKMMGRITLNPLKHIDPVGTILVPLILYLTTGFVFGWARPVPVNFNALNNPKRDMIFVALAGPFANLIMAFIWLFFMFFIETYNLQPLSNMAVIGMQINLILMIFNLLPIPPLDGARIISGLLPNNLSYYYNRLEEYGLYVILGLLLLGVFDNIILPIVNVIFVAMLGLI